MCYPCTMCNGCGKLNPDSPFYIPKIAIQCLDCGGDVDEASGKCLGCGKQVMIPLGESAENPVTDESSESDRSLSDVA